MSLPATALEEARATTTDTSLHFSNPQALTWENFEHLISFLGRMSGALPFWIGDSMNMAEDLFGEEHYQLDELLPHASQTIANYKSVAKHVPPSRRKKGLSFSVHEAVAYLPPRERDEWLDVAAKNGWKREEMRSAMQTRKALQAAGVTVDPAFLVLDPPKRTCPHCGGELA